MAANHELINVEVKQDPTASTKKDGWCVYFDTTVTPQRVMVGNIVEVLEHEPNSTHVYERYEKVDGLRYQNSRLKHCCKELRKLAGMCAPREMDQQSFEEWLSDIDEELDGCWEG